MKNAEWIWLDAQRHPDMQRCRVNIMDTPKDGQRFAVCAFRYKRTFKEIPLRLVFEVSGDTTFRFECNGDYIGRGPAAVGGDFEFPSPMPCIYSSFYEYRPKTAEIEIYAEVKMGSDVMTEYSCGGGGFYLDCEVIYRKGKSERFGTGKDWECRVMPAFLNCRDADFRLLPSEWEQAEISPITRKLQPAPIRNIAEEAVISGDFEPFTVGAGEKQTKIFDFDRIYAAYPIIAVEGGDDTEIAVTAQETADSSQATGKIIFAGTGKHRFLRMFSVGALEISVNNRGKTPVTVTDASIIAVSYPTATSLVNEKREDREGDFYCSDEYLNRLYELCRHTARICRQSLHLDSPRHQETLACAGDYLVESLIDAYAFGDHELTRFDLVRIAELLNLRGAKMFHTSYSLLWVEMLWDYYTFTGDAVCLGELFEAVNLLMERFNMYMGASGVLENAPNYMFVDWVEVDGYTLHHPPKALGQTVLNAFYYKALLTAALISDTVGDDAMKRRYTKRAANLKTAYNRCFYDTERKLYFSGMNSPDSPVAPPNKWLPENSLKRYYGVHENMLSVLFGLCDPFEKQALTVRALEDETLTQPQPYFMHFVLEAVSVAGLWGRYGFPLLQRWQALLSKTEKGLGEAWFDFKGDYSHAWGGTPAYQLPSKLSGLKIHTPGMGVISLSPRLYGLDFAKIKIPTGFGAIEISMKKGEEPVITVPDGITLI